MPVRANGENTYAFIDRGCATTLYAGSLSTHLGVKGIYVSQHMRSENGDFECNEVISLGVCGIDLEDIVPVKDQCFR